MATYLLRSLAQALRAGCPTLVVPCSQDQTDNARLGTSLTLPRNRYTAPRVAKQLHRLLENPSYAAQASHIGQRMQADNAIE